MHKYLMCTDLDQVGQTQSWFVYSTLFQYDTYVYRNNNMDSSFTFEDFCTRRITEQVANEMIGRPGWNIM